MGFDYNRFKELIDEQRSESAIEYYEQHFNGTDLKATLVKRLEIAGRLKCDYYIVGKKSSQELTGIHKAAQQCLVYIVESISKLKIDKNKDPEPISS